MEVPALEVRALTKRYRAGLWARPRGVLDGVDLTLAPGEAVGLLGPNGSGKSTLLRIAAAIERPSSGSVRILGEGSWTRSARARVGYLPDAFPFPPELSPRSVLDLLGSLHEQPRAERRRRAGELLERVGLAAVERAPLASFSLGMKRRFALAQAFLHRPEVLLFDEPTAGLDAEGYVVLEELLAEARTRGATLLLATHVLSDLEDHCQRVCVLVRGRLALEKPTVELLGDRARLVALYRELSAGAR